MRIYLHTLGCKVNQYESQALETIFREAGHEIVPEPSGCDAVVVNTCAVTAESVRKSRQALRRLRTECPDAVVAVCGCWPQAEPGAPGPLGADVVYGSGDRRRFAADVEKAFADRTPVRRVDSALSRRTFEPLPPGNTAPRNRALLKIEDGCVNFCAYCIIPYVRGPVRSLPAAQIASCAARLEAEGYREIVLTGIEIASYGRDLPERPSLADAVCAAAAAAPGARLRLGSLEPRAVTEAFCRALADTGRVCPHFHLSLQSGCDETLARMRRKYDTARFFESTRLLRRYFPGCGLTADLIVGFPGETEAEFAKTLSFVGSCAFSSMHIFPYSVRRGTAAADLPDKISTAEKRGRAKRAAAVAAASKDAFLRAQIGTVQQVLFESEGSGGWLGHAGNYALVLASGTNLRNRVANVQITGLKDGKLLGNLLV